MERFVFNFTFLSYNFFNISKLIFFPNRKKNAQSVFTMDLMIVSVIIFQVNVDGPSWFFIFASIKKFKFFNFIKKILFNEF